MNNNEPRIAKLRTYLVNVINAMVDDKEFQINVNMLSNDINNYSLDKIPTSSAIERWINGISIYRDVFSFKSRLAYSQDTINNLSNIGFFEKFENIIESNNKKGVLPEIVGIKSIECLNAGTMISSDTNTAEFDIQIQITYIKNKLIKEE